MDAVVCRVPNTFVVQRLPDMNDDRRVPNNGKFVYKTNTTMDFTLLPRSPGYDNNGE